MLVGFWSAEEIGLIGSNAFVNKPPVPPGELAAYLNFDMVGRMVDNKLTVQATGTSPVWARILEQANVAAGFELVLQPDPYQPTDVASFNQAGVPSLSFFTSTHTDYHRPGDTADKINYEDLDRVADFAAAIVKRIGDEAGSAAVHQGRSADKHRRPGRRARVHRARFPTTPPTSKDCCSAASLAAGQPKRPGCRRATSSSRSRARRSPTSTTTPTRLELLKMGEPVKIAFMRDGKRLETEWTPGARK